jgi:hemerythrin-like metal-binding protein
MYSLQWNEEFAVGVESIDREHRALFELFNDLHSSILRGETHSLTAEKLERLVQYTEEHFADEERLMAESGYPKLEEHCRSHRALTEQVQGMMDDLKRSQSVMNLPALKFLNEWVTLHILREDRSYVPWMQKVAETEAPAESDKEG